MTKPTSSQQAVSSAEAVLLGALAPGVNGPTWSTVKITFLTLGVCLAAMLGLAFSSSDSTMIIHVMLLVLITGVLFFLLSRYSFSTLTFIVFVFSLLDKFPR
ncbi:hypothetical protein AQUCO_03600116v1 [Aquilegia coerulea]|uniref:Uncharacterized protein n=1 Tax=Aquilegia coerulea TaxID=218851 RepID=A0A2G5CVC0_AQUCA|nr:hypothetical protein AQUCO_03600116v1 [Aquilegia coerulea]